VGGTNFGWLVFKAFFFLALIVAGIYFAYRYAMRKQGIRTNPSDALRVISYTPMGGNRSLQVVRVGDRYLLLGVGSDSVRLLVEIEDPEVKKQLTIEEGSAAPPKSFLESLRNILRRSGVEVGPAGEEAGFLDRQVDRLRRLAGGGRPGRKEERP
jgi:flagellar biosynthetic protein FliO